MNWVDPWGLWGGKEELTQSPGVVDRMKASIRTDFDRVVHPNRYEESSRVNTVMTYVGTTILIGANGAAGAGRSIAYWGPQAFNIIDFVGGLMPQTTPVGYGMYAGIGMWVWDKGTQAWEWVSDQLGKKCK